MGFPLPLASSDLSSAAAGLGVVFARIGGVRLRDPTQLPTN